MQELLLVNPRKRAKRRSTKAPSAAQKRARAQFAAMARARSKNPAKRRKSTAKRRTRRALTVSAPKRHVARRTRRRNPSTRRSATPSLLRKPMALLTPALMGALGATAVNTVLSKLPVPASFMTGRTRYLTQAVAAFALATVAGKLGVKGAMATQMAEGSLTVTLHQAITDIASGMGMNLSGMGYYLPGLGVQAVPSASGNAGRLMGVGKYMTGPGAPSNVAYMQGSTMARKQKVGGFGF